MRLAGVVAREEILFRVVRKAGARRPCVRAVTRVAIVVRAIGEPSVSLPVGNVWVQRLRLPACTRTRQLGVASKLCDSTQCKARVTVIVGCFSRHSFAFRAAVRKLGIVKINRFAPRFKVAGLVRPHIHEGDKLVAVVRDRKRSSGIGEGGSSSRSEDRLSSECRAAPPSSALHSAIEASPRSSCASSSSGVSGTTFDAASTLMRTQRAAPTSIERGCVSAASSTFPMAASSCSSTTESEEATAARPLADGPFPS
eukprot:3634206-Pleurochrysis_carterae.AAC.1